MRLELGTFPVHDIAFGSQTRYRDGMLEIDVDELVQLVKQDSRVARAEIELARPGESVRIWPVRDVVEPRIKVEGPGVVYPGICDRPIETVGSGRTHRLAGVGIVEVSTVDWHDAGGDPLDLFIDMSGPWAEALYHLSSLFNLCLVIEPIPELNIHVKNRAVHGAVLAMSDQLARTTKGLTPTQMEVFELKPVSPSLPRVVYFLGLHSPEGKSGSTETFCTSAYGYTKLQPPWAFHPNELLDGAITGPHKTGFSTSWVMANNPILLELYRRHGVDLNFVGVIMYRTEWLTQHEKDLLSYQNAKLAKLLGAAAAVVTWNAGGNEFIEFIRTIRACEHLGIKTVGVTSEEKSIPGVPTLLEPLPEADAFVSTGFSHATHFEPLLPVKRVIGEKTMSLRHWLGERRPTAPNTDTPPYNDHYGLGRWRMVDF